METPTSGGCVKSLTLRIALVAVRGWTRAYTWGVPPMWAEQRRAEIESDVWELQHDPDGAHGLTPAAQILARLLAGVADDLGWRLEQSMLDKRLFLRRALALTAVATVMLSLFWISPVVARGAADAQDGGRIAECATATPRPKSLAEFRFQVIKCTGAFFAAPPRTQARRPARD